MSKRAVKDEVTLAERIDEFVAVYGSIRAAGDAIGIDPGYLSRLRSGEKASPTKDMLVRLGLYKVVTYRRIRQKWLATPASQDTKGGDRG